MSVTREAVEARLAHHKVPGLTEQQKSDLLIQCRQFSMAYRTSAESQEVLIDSVLYLAHYKGNLYSNCKVRNFVDQLDQMPLFANLNTFKMICEDQIEGLLTQVYKLSTANDRRINSLIEAYKGRGNVKELFEGKFRTLISRAQEEFCEYAANNPIASYPDMQKVSKRVFLNQITADEELGGATFTI